MLHMDHQVKDQQHQKLFSLQNQLKQQEQSNFGAQSTLNHKKTELSSLQDKITYLNEQLHRNTVQLDETSMKYEIARAEHQRNTTENIALSNDCESVKCSNVNLLDVQRQLVRSKENESTKNLENNNVKANAESTLSSRDAEL